MTARKHSTRSFSTLPSAFLALTLFAASAVSNAQSIQVVTEASGFTTFEQGRAGGPATSVVEATLKQASLTDYRISVLPWARAYSIASEQPNVLIYLIARTAERESRFKWIGEVVAVRYHFFKLKSNHQVEVRTLADAKAYRVGVTRNDVRENYLRQQGFFRLVESADNAANFQKLIDGQVQLIPLPDQDAAALCKQLDYDCANLSKVYTLDSLTMDLYMAYSASTQDEIVDRTRRAFERVKNDKNDKNIVVPLLQNAQAGSVDPVRQASTPIAK